jgi:hypothetical protein
MAARWVIMLVRVGMAADVDQQGGVVNDRALLLVEPDALGQPHRDQALAKHVLHGLAETEVYAQRKGSHQLRQPNLRTIDLAGHVRRRQLVPSEPAMASAGSDVTRREPECSAGPRTLAPGCDRGETCSARLRRGECTRRLVGTDSRAEITRRALRAKWFEIKPLALVITADATFCPLITF